MGSPTIRTYESRAAAYLDAGRTFAVAEREDADLEVTAEPWRDGWRVIVFDHRQAAGPLRRVS
jgi:hypothetical protein